MNRSVTSEAAILEAARTLLLEQGAEALSMRAVAAACGIAVGSLYNYFPSKGALVRAAVESVWADIFHPFLAVPKYASSGDCVAALLQALAQGETRHPGFFSVHALSIAAGEKQAGRAQMARLLAGLRDKMVATLAADADVRPGVFDGAMTPEAFSHYVLTLAISLQLQPGDHREGLLAMVHSCIY